MLNNCSIVLMENIILNSTTLGYGGNKTNKDIYLYIFIYKGIFYT